MLSRTAKQCIHHRPANKGVQALGRSANIQSQSEHSPVAPSGTSTPRVAVTLAANMRRATVCSVTVTSSARPRRKAGGCAVSDLTAQNENRAWQAGKGLAVPARPRLTLGNVKAGGCVCPDEARDDLSWWHICHTGLRACRRRTTMG